MRKPARLAAAAATIAILTTSAMLTPTVAGASEADMIKKGQEVAFDRKKGNCLACHMIKDGVSPGDIGPPLVAMKARFQDPAKLREQIWDPQIANPATRMPPFGKHKILSEQEVDEIVSSLLTL